MASSPARSGPPRSLEVSLVPIARRAIWHAGQIIADDIRVILQQVADIGVKHVTFDYVTIDLARFCPDSKV